MLKSYPIIGLMSGTSMDGVDLAFATYEKTEKGQWNYTLNNTKTFPYPPILLDDLKKSIEFNSCELLILDKKLGAFFSDIIIQFMDEYSIKRESVSSIASHGHTIFHNPTEGYTYQIGCGDSIAYRTGIKVINDFRQKDVIAGGQGAPLVPIGDKLLFSNLADAFLNIGGICNICIPGSKTIAFDICPGNLPLNKVIQRIGYEYDKNGEHARKGNIDYSILEKLAQLKYYQTPPPKSLGEEWLAEYFYPILNSTTNELNQLRTLIDHISTEISNCLNSSKVKSVLISGGGAKNTFLVEQIQSKFKGEVIVPDPQLIDFKEAIIFGFLGALFLANETNALASVTGAERDTIGGVLHFP